MGISIVGPADGHVNYSAPSTGFALTLADDDWHVILNPAGTLAAGTITMPPFPFDGQVVNIRSSQIITALTFTPNTGQSVVSAPTTIAARGEVEAVYRLATTSWYFSSNAAAGGGGGVNAGTINQIAYYAAAGSTVSGETLLQAVNMPALTGDVTNTVGTLATVIGGNTVSNPKLSQAIANSFKGNPTGALANVTDMTATQATALLNIFTTALQGLAPASGGGTANFLRADGTWNTPGIPINNQSSAYTAVLGDANSAIVHPTTDNTARTFFIPFSGSVAYPIGTTLTFVNMVNTLTISISTDTLTLAGTGTTGSRTLAANGIATALKLTSTTWLISGTGLT